ncbi:DUF4189 domain-containing protein [Nocardia mangyaensis]|uniref:DUF4189 domain-containing protein n=1 Tax=Nocardia mangyaensis TaxID=2213200 RepID=UPI0026756C46|nr:DUF4189 domain-containing protein [Nocardia mangyaensis]MDO3647657.1 DUF4189 domain-containing protein [Nocardia mangyaensis]
MKSLATLGLQLASVVALAGIGATVTAAPASAESTLYASIAISRQTGATAAAWNYPTQRAAEKAAKKACKKSDCKPYVTVASGYCAAVARATNKNWSWARATTRGVAAANAVGVNSGPQPRVVNSVCQNAALGIGALESFAPEQPTE